MEQSKKKVIPFSLLGLVTKASPEKLGPGQYPYISNMESQQEGALWTRSGSKILGSGPANTDIVYQIRKLRIGTAEDPKTPATNLRYVGMVTSATTADIYRTANYSAFTRVATSVNSSGNYVALRWNLAEYSGGPTGNYWAFIASENKMLRDNGAAPYSTLRTWGLLPAWGVAIAADGGAGNLDGGAAASPAQSQAYDYRYTWVDSETGDESNPSEQMVAGTLNAPLAVNNRAITVTVYGTNDPKVDRIAIYRRGGLLYDTWRRVGYIANPGASGAYPAVGTPTSAAFYDNVPDDQLVYATQLEFDHDPPIPSALPTPCKAVVVGAIAVGAWQTVFLDRVLPVTLTIGTRVTISGAGSASWNAIVVQVTTGGVTALGMYLPTTLAGGETLTVSAIAGAPCPLTCQAFSSLFCAGDPNNPSTVYKSKVGYPSYFPLETDGGIIGQIQAGSPSDPIMALLEFRGSIVCLNLSSIYEMSVVNGIMYTPNRTPAKRGLIARYAWCVVDNEIWYLAKDGIWSWDGATSTKRSEAIDPIFHSEVINTGKNIDNSYGMPPMSFASSDLQWAQMEYYRGEVRFLYRDTGGKSWCLRCSPLYGDRWTFEDYRKQPGDYIVTDMFCEPDTGSLILGRESATTPTFLMADRTVVSGADNLTSDNFTTAPSDGDLIPYEFRTPWYDMGDPNLMKGFTELLLDVDPQLDSATAKIASLNIDMFFDYAGDTATYTHSVAIPGGGSVKGRQLISLLPNVSNISGTYQSFAKEARAVQFRFSGSAFSTQIKFYNLLFTYYELGELTAGVAMGWDNLGTENDKKLHQVKLTFDTRGSDFLVAIDMMSGRDGKVYTREGVGIFTCSNPSSGPPTGSPVQVSKTFPIPDSVGPVKAVRVREVSTAAGITTAATSFFKLLSYKFDAEEYPPDIVPFTRWEDGGYLYDKYCQQVDLVVNTNGQNVTIKVQADNADKQTITVNATDRDRRRNFTLLPGLSGKQWRLYCDTTQTSLTSGTGMFQLFSHSFVFQKADMGEVGHSFDWDELEHPYDKLLLTVTIDYDANVDITLQLDTIGGINGSTLSTNVTQFALTGHTRGKITFPIPPDTVAKMVRLYPIGSPPTSYKQIKYRFNHIPYPADIVRVTGWKDASNPVDKEPSWLFIDADTSNVGATVYLENESGVVLTVTHSGTFNNRKFNYAIPADTHAKMWRIRAVEGTNGRFQLFDWGFARWAPFDLASPIDPPEIILATPWTDFGYPFEKLARNLILTINTGGVNCTVNLQTGEAGTVETFTVNTSYTNRRIVLPCNSNLSGKLWRLTFSPGTNGKAQLWDWTLDNVKEPAAVTHWDSYELNWGYKFYKLLKQVWMKYSCASPITMTITTDTGTYVKVLPAHATRAVERFLPSSVFGSGLNKSILYRLQLDAATPFKFYQEGSGLEFLPMGIDRHYGYQQVAISELMTLGEG